MKERRTAYVIPERFGGRQWLNSCFCSVSVFVFVSVVHILRARPTRQPRPTRDPPTRQLRSTRKLHVTHRAIYRIFFACGGLSKSRSLPAAGSCRKIFADGNLQAALRGERFSDPNREIIFGFRFVSCMPCVPCVRAGEARRSYVRACGDDSP